MKAGGYLEEILSPSSAPSHTGVLVGILGIVLIFAIDLADGSRIWTHALYVFPVCGIAFCCKRFGWAVIAVVLSMVFQLLTLLTYDMSTVSVVANLFIALAANAMTVGLARAARAHFARVATLATTDALTGIHNRRGFVALVDQELARQKRYGGVFALVILDLDRFKALNDAKGHAAGDQALCLLAEILRENTRSSDSLGRLGGDEFAILMPNAQATDCAPLCQQLSSAIADRMVSAGFDISASIGYATCESSSESTDAVLHRADQAMYAAKATRSKVMSLIADDPMSTDVVVARSLSTVGPCVRQIEPES
jgi:diguanylate cyclase (GGDEF)-like protein